MTVSYYDRQITNNCFQGLKLFEPDCYNDFRGYYWTIFNSKATSLPNFNHDKATVSRKNVLRGIHGDFNTTKLISCLYGEVYCVAVDKREESSTYNSWAWSMLSHTNRKSVLFPPGVGLGYMVMSDEATVLYKLAYQGEYQDAKDQFTFKWSDPELSIFWPNRDPILQQRDL